MYRYWKRYKPAKDCLQKTLSRVQKSEVLSNDQTSFHLILLHRHRKQNAPKYAPEIFLPVLSAFKRIAVRIQEHRLKILPPEYTHLRGIFRFSGRTYNLCDAFYHFTVFMHDGSIKIHKKSFDIHFSTSRSISFQNASVPA